MSQVDLHLHTCISDGRFSPAELVRKAVESELTVMAIADHDAVDGIVAATEAARAFPGLKLLPGVEISTDVPHGEAHLLGYFVDCANPELLNALERLRDSRVTRAKGMIVKLANLGIPIKWERVRELARGSSIGRPHIAQAMLEKGYISSFKEAFTRYIGRDGPAYVEREKVTPVEAVTLVLRANGLPVLAHPFTVKDVEPMVVELKAAGLVGIEAYYDNYTAEQVAMLVQLANKYDLVPTGGSDYHGLDDTAETAIGGADVPMASAERLMALAKQRGLKGVV